MDTVESSLGPFVQEAQAILERLCRQPSVAAQGLGMEAMAGIVEVELQDAGFATRRFTGAGAPPIIYGEQRGRGPFTLLLYNHYDVQPPEPLELWESPPFEPAVRDGKLYARGVADNKGELAARLAAMRALRATDGELPITIKWIVEGEEEIGSVHFEQLIAPHAALLRADGCLWEGTGFAEEPPTLCLGYKGLLYVELEVACLRQDAHSGMAGLLPSAAWRLAGALGTLRTPDGRVAIPGFYDAVRPPTAADLATYVDRPDLQAKLLAMFGLERFLDGLTGLAWWERASFAPTGNIAGLGSGYTGEGMKTVLPARALAKLDFRLVPNQNPHTIAAALRAYLDAQGYADVQLKILAAVEADQTPLTDPFVQRVAAIAASFSGQQPVVIPLGAATLPLLAALRRHVGPPGLSAPTNTTYVGGSAHAPNEHIRLEDLRRAVGFNSYLMRSLSERGGSRIAG